MRVTSPVFVPDAPPFTVTVTTPAEDEAATPAPTKFSLTAFRVRAVPSSSTLSTETKQFVSVGPQGSVNSDPGSMVAPIVKGLVRATAKLVVNAARVRREAIRTRERKIDDIICDNNFVTINLYLFYHRYYVLRI